MRLYFATPGALLLLLPLVSLSLLMAKKLPSRFHLLFFLPALLVTLALGEPTIVTPGAGTHTVYLVDASASVSTEQFRRALTYVETSAAGVAAPDTVSLSLFARRTVPVVTAAQREGAVSAGLADALGRREEADPSASDLGRGIRESAALLPQSGDRRLVLLSDGVDTEKRGATEASLLSEGGIRLSTVYLSGDGRREDLRVSDMQAPSFVEAGDIYELAVRIEGDTTPGGELLLFAGDELLNAEPLAGDAAGVYRYRLNAPAAGSREFRAVISHPSDNYPENNSSSRVVTVSGGASVLYLRGGEKTRPFESALRAQGVSLTQATPESLEQGLLALAQHEAIILDALPASRFPLSLMRDIERYVRDTGGGLIVLGGPESFGAGGYGQTPLEEALPVSVDVTSKVQVPTLAMIFIVDKSGSMGNSGGNASKLDIVKEALISSVEVLHPNQLVGLLSFDADVEWSVPVTRAANREEILRNIARLRGGGGTILGAAMNEAAERLSEVDAATQHLIILSDGLTREADFLALTKRLRELGATVSTVSIGTDADKGLMESIATEGSGRYYHTDDTAGIPRIFTEETSIVARNVIVEETFFPILRREEGVLSGIEEGAIPPLRGFLLTYPKASTRLLLEHPDGHPLLAVWQYGLGRAAAFTSSVDELWGSPWIGWDLLPRLAGQLVNWSSRPQSAGALRLLNREVAAETGRITVEAVDAGGGFLNGLELVATVSEPGGGSRNVSVRQNAPGRYTAEIDVDEGGTYLIALHDAAGTVSPSLLPLHRGYPKEFAFGPPDPGYLQRVARAGGGVSLLLKGTGFPEDALPTVSSGVGGKRRIAPTLLVAALLLLTGLVLAEALSSRRPRQPRPTRQAG